MLISHEKGRWALGLAALGVSASLAACGGSSSDNAGGGAGGGSTGGSAPAAKSDASKGAAKAGVVIVGDQAVASAVDPDGPSATDPQNLNVENSAYLGLTEYRWKPNDASLGGGQMLDASDMAPGLATKWELKDRSATFWLREGVKNSYGHEFTSADVVYTYRRNMGLNAIGKFILTANGNITGVRADGKYKVTYTTSGPAPVMLAGLASAYAKPVDSVEVQRHTTKKDPWAAKWLAKNTAGFGAYQLSSFTPGKQVVLTPVQGYFDQAQNQIKILPIPDASNRLDSLKKGDINLAVGLTPEQDQSAARDSALHQFRFNGNVALNLYPNEKKTPAVKNKLVRQAMHYAIPTDQIIRQVYLGYAFNPKSIVPPYVAGFTDKYWQYSYNINKAKDLMKQAGYAKGFSMDLYYASESATLAQVAPIVQAAYQQIGIKVNLKSAPQAQILTRAFGARDMQSFFVDLAASVPPALANLSSIWQTGVYGNDTEYSNKEFDAVAKKSAQTLDPNDPVNDEMQKIVADDPPTVMLAGLQTVANASANVSNYSWTPEGSIAFRTLKVTAGQ
jgi:peptide/nickel transport system substrate-binding protein